MKRASHTHPRFKEDNSKVHYYIQESTRRTRYSASINPYQNINNGRDAFIAVLDQYTGDYKGQNILKDCTDIFHNRYW